MPTYTANTPRSEFEPLPPGNYKVKVLAAESKFSTSGNEMIELKLMEKESRQFIFDRLVFTEKAFFRIDQFRAATGDEIKPGEEVTIEPDDCLNRVGWVKLKITEHNGKQKNEVEAWLTSEPVPERVKPQPKPAPKDDLAPDDVPF